MVRFGFKWIPFRCLPATAASRQSRPVVSRLRPELAKPLVRVRQSGLAFRRVGRKEPFLPRPQTSLSVEGVQTLGDTTRKSSHPNAACLIALDRVAPLGIGKCIERQSRLTGEVADFGQIDQDICLP